MSRISAAILGQICVYLTLELVYEGTVGVGI
jgi:hypothetical protein